MGKTIDGKIQENSNDERCCGWSSTQPRSEEVQVQYPNGCAKQEALREPKGFNRKERKEHKERGKIIDGKIQENSNDERCCGWSSTQPRSEEVQVQGPSACAKQKETFREPKGFNRKEHKELARSLMERFR
jgi:hypothetical protein